MCFLESYLVPAGTTLVLNIYGVHRDSNFWPNPEVFDPDKIVILIRTYHLVLDHVFV